MRLRVVLGETDTTIPTNAAANATAGTKSGTIPAQPVTRGIRARLIYSGTSAMRRVVFGGASRADATIVWAIEMNNAASFQNQSAGRLGAIGGTRASV